MKRTLYAFYYVEKEIDIILLYAYTDKKDLAKAFWDMRNQKALRKIKKVFDQSEIDDQIFEDSLVQDIYGKTSTRFRTKELEWHPLTDGVHEYLVPLTYVEVAEISAKVEYLEEISGQNKSDIMKSLLKPKIKKMLDEANATTHYTKDVGRYSVINTLKIFADTYKHLLRF